MSAPSPLDPWLARESKLGQELVDAGVLKAQALADAIQILRARPGQSLQRILTERGQVDAVAMAGFFAERHGLTYWAVDPATLDAEVAGLVPYSLCTNFTMLPICATADTIRVAIAHPLQYIPVEQALEAELGLGVEVVLATEREIRDALKTLYADECVVDRIELLGHGAALVDEVEPTSEDSAEGRDEDDGASAVGTVNTILAQGIARGASDIHVDPGEHAVRIRMRVDGVMSDLATLPTSLLPPLVARIKVISGLDIGERRLPQDGAIQLKAMGRRVDLRVSTLPNVNGERVCMRILDATAGPGTLEEVGFAPETLDALRESLDASHGILLVTGPTGSGKSSTLYAALRYLNRPETNIMTVEDPVEFRVQGISQTQTHGKIGLDFARVLEAFLRQDPDVLLLGEIRNEETAQIAARASLTGHRVLSTLHVQSATESITRLVEMGIPAYVLGSTLRAVVSQRLVRRLCRNCKTQDVVGGDRIAAWGGDPAKAMIGPGCERCGYTGYKGRMAITELFTVDAEARAAILAELPAHEVEQIAIRSGMRRLGHSALAKVEQGLTSISEVLPYLDDLPRAPHATQATDDTA